MLHEVLNPGNCLGNLGYGGGIGTAHISFATFAEGVARHQCHMLPHKELLSKFFGGEPGGGDIREDVESSLWLEAFQPSIGQAVINQAAALVVLCLPFQRSASESGPPLSAAGSLLPPISPTFP